ncbi:MAG: hypothetical protein MSA15_19255 [Clostridium sp.]|nr:hypothetical protein [Clostridium sp.]
MKITMYELLGLVKDGKAPKKILLNGIAFEYQGDDYLYKDEDKKEHWLFSTSYTDKYIWLENFLKAEVEIIKEDKKIKKLDEILMINDLIPPYGENEYKAWKNIIIQQNKINELIDEINNLKEND